jgi:hypothetical protein
MADTDTIRPMIKSQETPSLLPVEGGLREYAGPTSTFISNMKQPVHRWFRYSAGFSADWVKEVITQHRAQSCALLFDPFAGSGTTVLAAQECGVNAVGIESHPFVLRIAKAKLAWSESIERFSKYSDEILALARRQGGDTRGYSKLIYDCFPEDSLHDLDALRRAWLDRDDDSPSSLLGWLALTKILRECSPVGTSQMELIQPKKKKKNVSRPFEAFTHQVSHMLGDMSLFRRNHTIQGGEIHRDDARTCSLISDASVSLALTSPPYINNFDYADATRLEMTFWREIKGWGDLQHSVRQYLVRSCAQHMSYQEQSLTEILNSETLLPIKDELHSVCFSLSNERLKHGGKKNYHLMTAAYFLDMAAVWLALRRVCRDESRVCFVVGDSAPYGIYVPVHEWLGRLAVAAGFKTFSFDKLRDRNIKWQNRKHRVPLCEGRLWVEG